MKSKLERLVAIGEMDYELYLRGAETSVIRCRVVSGTEETWEVGFDGPTRLDISEVRRAVLSLHLARTVRYSPPARAVRNSPPWFDPTPLRLVEITAINTSEYAVDLVNPDGKLETITLRLRTSVCGEQELLTVDPTGEPRILARIYLPDVNKAAADFHAAVHTVS